MTHTYNITGMTCNGCVSKTKHELLKLGDVTEAQLQLVNPQATITMQKHIALNVLQQALSKAGNYKITEHADPDQKHHDESSENNPPSWFNTYKPLIIICAYITGITILLELTKSDFNWHSWMQNFMAAFFLVFSFFKLLDLRGFADSYSTYDIIAKTWKGWGYFYPFIELALGLGYLLRLNPLVINGLAFAVMSLSIIGVVQSVFSNRKVKCACLGSVFNLPMSTVTIIEDALMIIMSFIMLITLL